MSFLTSLPTSEAFYKLYQHAAAAAAVTLFLDLFLLLNVSI